MYIFGVIILIMLFITITLNSRIVENSLFTGFWKGDTEFCAQSETDVFLVYLGQPSLFSFSIPGYILVKNADGLIMNNPFTLHISGGYSIKPGTCNDKIYNVEFEWDDSNIDFDFFPSKQEMCYYPLYGKLVLYKEDQVYAILYKDNQLSSINTQQSMPKSLTESIDNSVNESEPDNLENDLDI